MKLTGKWSSSAFMVGGWSVLLLIALRNMGPSGSGVRPMLAMQTAWKSLSALHATGTILESRGSTRHITRFELWKGPHGERRAVLLPDTRGAATTCLITPEHAWKWSSNRNVLALDPGRANLDPLPDPDSDTTFYRYARRWAQESQVVVNGVPCTRFAGQSAAASFHFDLDNATHLPRRVEIMELQTPLHQDGNSPTEQPPLPQGALTGGISRASTAAPIHWTVTFNRVETPPTLPESLFSAPTTAPREKGEANDPR